MCSELECSLGNFFFRKVGLNLLTQTNFLVIIYKKGVLKRNFLRKKAKANKCEKSQWNTKTMKSYL